MSIVNFDLRQLQYFLAVAENLNISQAARELGISQPALSRQLRVFEDHLGWELFMRHGKSISLTRAGKIMQQEGATLLNGVRRSLKRAHGEISGAELRIGYAPSLATDLIEKVLGCFSASYPKVKIRWFDFSTEAMWEGLKDESLDLIVEAESDDSAIRWQKIREIPVRIAVPAEHDFSKKRFLKPEHLNGENFLLLSRHEYPKYWSGLADYFKKHRIDAKVVGEFDGIASLRMGVTAGLGIAFVAGSPPGVKTIPLKPPADPVCVAVGSLKKRALEPWEDALIAQMIKVGMI